MADKKAKKSKDSAKSGDSAADEPKQAAAEKSEPEMKSKGEGAKAGKAKSAKGDTEATTGGGAQGYLCVHCGHRFEASEEPKRCPSCMRKGGLERVAAGERRSAAPSWLMPAVVVGLVGAVGVGYALWNDHTPDVVEGDAPVRPLELSELRGYLRNAHADGDHAELLEGGENVSALAAHATGGDAFAQAGSLVEYIRAQAEAQAFVVWAMDQPRELPPKFAEWAAGEILRDGGRRELYPLEVAAATVAALREAGVAAMVAEAWAYPSERRPPEPAGHFGYFAVAVYAGAAGEGDPRIFDPYAGRSQAPEAGAYRVLTDVQAVGDYLGHEALHAMVHENDATSAMSKAERALGLDARSPSIRTVRGAVLLASGGIEEGVGEFEAAARIREDPPRRNNLGAVLLATGDVEGATREVSAALEATPDFAGAHANLGAIYLSQAELDRARAELNEAERLAPELGMLPMLFAQLYMRTGEVELAAQRADDAIQRRPRDWQVALNAAQIFRAVGRYDDMRRQAHRVLDELVPESQRGDVRQMIERALGPTALEEVEDDFAELDDEPLPEEDELGELDGLGDLPELQLGGGDGPSLLGGDDDGPSLLGGEGLGGGDDGPALMLGDPSNFRLGGSDELRLDL